MSSLDRPDNMFAVEDDGTLVMERAAFFRLERQCSGTISAGDCIHYQTPYIHRIWRLTGERDLRGAYRGIWPD